MREGFRVNHRFVSCNKWDGIKIDHSFFTYYSNQTKSRTFRQLIVALNFKKTRPAPICRVPDINIFIDLTLPVSIKALKPPVSIQAHHFQFKPSSFYSCPLVSIQVLAPTSFNSSLESHQFQFKPRNSPVSISTLKPTSFTQRNYPFVPKIPDNFKCL